MFSCGSGVQVSPSGYSESDNVPDVLKARFYPPSALGSREPAKAVRSLLGSAAVSAPSAVATARMLLPGCCLAAASRQPAGSAISLPRSVSLAVPRLNPENKWLPMMTPSQLVEIQTAFKKFGARQGGRACG